MRCGCPFSRTTSWGRSNLTALSPGVKRELFSTTRDRLKRGSRYNALMEAIVEALGDDPQLQAANTRRHLWLLEKQQKADYKNLRRRLRRRFPWRHTLPDPLPLEMGSPARRSKTTVLLRAANDRTAEQASSPAVCAADEPSWAADRLARRAARLFTGSSYHSMYVNVCRRHSKSSN
jgi:hypothetical protein